MVRAFKPEEFNNDLEKNIKIRINIDDAMLESLNVTEMEALKEHSKLLKKESKKIVENIDQICEEAEAKLQDDLEDMDIPTEDKKLVLKEFHNTIIKNSKLVKKEISYDLKHKLMIASSSMLGYLIKVVDSSLDFKKRLDKINPQIVSKLIPSAIVAASTVLTAFFPIVGIIAATALPILNKVITEKNMEKFSKHLNLLNTKLQKAIDVYKIDFEKTLKEKKVKEKSAKKISILESRLLKAKNDKPNQTVKKTNKHTTKLLENSDNKSKELKNSDNKLAEKINHDIEKYSKSKDIPSNKEEVEKKITEIKKAVSKLTSSKFVEMNESKKLAIEKTIEKAKSTMLDIVQKDMKPSEKINNMINISNDFSELTKEILDINNAKDSDVSITNVERAKEILAREHEADITRKLIANIDSLTNNLKKTTLKLQLNATEKHAALKQSGLSQKSLKKMDQIASKSQSRNRMI